MGLFGKSDCAKPTLDAKAGAPSAMAIAALFPRLTQREHSSACNMLLFPVDAMQRLLRRHAIARTRRARYSAQFALTRQVNAAWAGMAISVPSSYRLHRSM